MTLSMPTPPAGGKWSVHINQTNATVMVTLTVPDTVPISRTAALTGQVGGQANRVDADVVTDTAAFLATQIMEIVGIQTGVTTNLGPGVDVTVV